MQRGLFVLLQLLIQLCSSYSTSYTRKYKNKENIIIFSIFFSSIILLCCAYCIHLLIKKFLTNNVITKINNIITKYCKKNNATTEQVRQVIRQNVEYHSTIESTDISIVLESP